MYRVYLDDSLIHHQNDNDLRLNTAKVEQELNKAGSFVYSMNQNHECYGMEQKLKSIVTVYSDDNLIFRGRVLNIDIGFYGDRTVTCEGELSFLLDSIQRPYEFSGSPETLFNQLLNSHNSEVEETKKFVVGNVTVVDANDYIVRSDSTYLNTRESLDKKLIDPLGGYLVVRREDSRVYLDYKADLTEYNTQEVVFGENLLDLSKTISGEDIVTAVIPIGAEDEETEVKLTIADVNNGVDYVYNQDAVEQYGWIFQTVEYEDVTLASNLLTKAYEVLDEVVSNLPIIELTAVDLNALDCEIASFEVGKLTKVVSDIHGLSEEYLTTKRSINLLNPADSKLSLGGSQGSLTNTTSTIDKDVSNMSGDIASVSSSVSSASAKVDTTAKDIVDIKSDISSINTNISNVKDAVSTVATSTQNVSDEVTELKKYIKTENDQLQISNASIGSWRVSENGISATTTRVHREFTEDDLELLTKYLEGDVELSEEILEFDLNEDGVVDVTDHELIEKCISGEYSNEWTYCYSIDSSNPFSLITLTVDRGNDSPVEDITNTYVATNSRLVDIEERLRRLEEVE